MEHHLQVIVVPEDFLVPFDDLVDLLHVPRQNRAGNLARHAGRTADQAFVVFLQDLVAHAGAVIHALDMGRGHDFHEVLVAFVVLRQEDEVIVPLLLHPMVPFRDIDLAPDDGLHRGVLLRELEELLHAVHVPVIRDREAGHAQLLGPVEQVVDGRLAVQDGILGMYVKMDEGHGTISCGNKDSTMSRNLRKKFSTTARGRGQNFQPKPPCRQLAKGVKPASA